MISVAIEIAVLAPLMTYGAWQTFGRRPLDATSRLLFGFRILAFVAAGRSAIRALIGIWDRTRMVGATGIEPVTPTMSR
jgi:hypothetical protein